MEKLTFIEIAKAVNGKINNNSHDVEISEITTNSRTSILNGLFIPLIGENFDGHDYIEDAVDNGARAVISQVDLAIKEPYILVSNTKKALMDLAMYYLEKIRSKTNIPVVAITGSTGKTSTKDLISNTLSAKYKVLKTMGNFNNEIGLPLTVFNLTYEHEVLVLEMGMNNFGEIHNLSKIAKPDIAVITNIGISHAEFLGGRDGVFKAKTEIFDFMGKDGKIVIWGEDDFLKTIKEDEKFLLKFAEENIFYYGAKNTNDVVASNIKYMENLSGMTFMADNNSYEIPFCGEHMVINSLAAICVAKLLGLSQIETKNGLLTAEISKMRLNIEKNEKRNITVINDAYNANPISAKAALDVLSNASGRKVAILGDMFELGEFTKSGHFETGEHAYNSNVDLLITIGKHSKHTYDGFNMLNKLNTKEMLYFENVSECLKQLEKFLKNGDVVLVKASRSMKLEEIAKFIENIL